MSFFQRTPDAEIKKTFRLLSEALITVDEKITYKWLSDSTPEQIAAINDLLVTFHTVDDSTQSLISYVLRPLRKRNSTRGLLALHDTIALWEAFRGPKVANQEQYNFEVFAPIVMGLRGSIRTPLDLSDPLKRQEYEALVSFIFEVCVGKHAQSLQSAYHRVTGASTMTLKDPQLKSLIIRYAPQRERLVATALQRGTTDPEVLEMMLSGEITPALSEGVL